MGVDLVVGRRVWMRQSSVKFTSIRSALDKHLHVEKMQRPQERHGMAVDMDGQGSNGIIVNNGKRGTLTLTLTCRGSFPHQTEIRLVSQCPNSDINI